LEYLYRQSGRFINRSILGESLKTNGKATSRQDAIAAPHCMTLEGGYGHTAGFYLREAGMPEKSWSIYPRVVCSLSLLN